MKWCAWTKVCKPVVERGTDIKELGDVIRSFQMKFAWRLMTVNNLWTNFFKAKYLKLGHLATTLQNTRSS